MLKLNFVFSPVRVRFSTRPALTGLLCATAILIGILADTTVRNLQSNDSLPQTRVAILLSALGANLVLMWLRPVLPLHEHMTARRGWRVRALVGAGAVGAYLLLASAASPSGSRIYTLATAAGFLGISLVAGVAATGIGLVAPWLYAMAGLIFGFQARVGGPATIRPWAWMVGDGQIAPQLVLCLLGLLAYTWKEPEAYTPTGPVDD